MPRRYHLIVGDGEVEALEITAGSLSKAISWTGGLEVTEIDPFDNRLRFAAVNIPTSDGMRRASQGDYVIKDALGNFSTMGPQMFHSTYSLNEEEPGDFNTRDSQGRGTPEETQQFRLDNE